MEKMAFSLEPILNAELVNKFLMSLDKPDREIDSKWKAEADRRVRALKAGRLETVHIQELLKRYQL